MTVAAHLLTGYLALLSLGIFAIVRPTKLPRRLVRGALVGVGALLIAAWVVVPLLLDRAYTIQDEFSRGKVYYDSFGATQIMKWAVSGELFDRNRFPVLSILVAVGLLVALWRSRRDDRTRALIGVGLLSLVLFFGRVDARRRARRCCRAPATCSCVATCSGCTSRGCTCSGSGSAWAGRLVVRLFRRWTPIKRAALATAVAAVARRRRPLAGVDRARAMGLAGRRVDPRAARLRRHRRRRRRPARADRRGARARTDLRRHALELGIDVPRRPGPDVHRAHEPRRARSRLHAADVVARLAGRVPVPRHERAALRRVRRPMGDRARGPHAARPRGRASPRRPGATSCTRCRPTASWMSSTSASRSRPTG